MNRFAQAKADWLKLSTLTDEELWEKILETAVHPQTHLTELIPGMSRKVLGVFPLTGRLQVGSRSPSVPG